MKDVAEQAGVGVGTVSRVVNGGTNVSLKTRERVEAAIRRLNFNPDPIAQSMRSGQTKMFACIVRDFSVPILSMFVNAMQDAVDVSGFGLQVASSYHDTDREIVMLEKLARRRIDGIVIASSSESDEGLLETISSSEVPIVLLDRDKPENVDAVLIDHRAGVRTAIQRLIDLGHLRIAMLTGQEGVRPVRERVAGYREAFRSRNVEPSPELIRCGSFTTDFVYSETAQMLRSEARPTAIYAGGTAMLAAVLRAIRDVGLRVPQDVSVVAGADSELALLHTPAISAVRWEHDQLGAAAARFLLSRVEKRDGPVQRMVFPTEFVMRESCGPAPS
ncbi:MAG: substrate-binding domain-containing protein [Myxococcota bacterium]|jgi:LacI family transcriptional regulator